MKICVKCKEEKGIETEATEVFNDKPYCLKCKEKLEREQTKRLLTRLQNTINTSNTPNNTPKPNDNEFGL